MPKEQKPTIFEKQDEEIDEVPEGFREGDDHDATSEEVELKMHVGGAEVDVYTEEGREELAEDDEVADWEEGFASGENDPEQAHCAACGKVLSQDKDEVVEREIRHERKLFCSDKCAQTGIQHGQKK
jgi:hypothetical protein